MKKNTFTLPPNAIMPKSGDAVTYGLNTDPLANRPGLRFLGTLPTTTSRKVRQSIIGVGYETLDRDTFDPALTYAPMADTGVKWARMQTGWLRCEREKGVYDFAWLDKVVDALLAIGIQPWFSVSFGNPLYTPVAGYATWAAEHPGEPVPHSVRGYVGEVPMYHGAEAVKGWENYLTALARHFAGRVTHYEIWNEPNTAPFGFWRTGDRYAAGDRSTFEANCARDYVELVKISARTIRAADPAAKIIGGSISLSLDACFFIRNLVENGITGHIDILSFHPYGQNPEFGLEERYGNLRYELDTHGGRHIKIWQGEVGCPTIPHEVVYSGNPYVQAKYITRRFAADFRIGCDMSSYFMVMDKQAYNAGDGVCGYGVLDVQGRPKLSFQALQAMGYLFDSAERADDLYLRVNIYGAPLMSHLRHIAMCLGKFRRKGLPVFSFHVPENPELSMEPGLLDLQVWIDKHDRLEDPVLIDPIRRKVYAIENFESCSKGFQYPPLGFDENVQGFITFHGLPFADYPLYISDRNIMNDGMAS